MPGLIADRRLYLAADNETVVEDGDPRAAFLLSGPGGEIPGPEVERLGLTGKDDKIILPQDQPAKKEAAKAEDKAVAKPATKGRKKKG